jgi:hypothetical protein
MSSDQKPPVRATSSASVRKASLGELIAGTPGAQPRDQLVERIKRREGRRPEKSSEARVQVELSKPEPLPIIDKPDQFAADFFDRLKARESEKRKPPKRSKPKLMVDNGKSGA